MKAKTKQLETFNNPKVVTEKAKTTLSDVVLFIVIGLLFFMTIALVVGTLISIKQKHSNFLSVNLIKNFIYIILTTAILITLDTFIHNKKLSAKELTKTFVYLALLLVVNTFNIFNLYNNLFINIFAYVLLGVIYSIIGISIYYNYLKNQQNQVKAKAGMVFWFGIALSVTFAFALEFLKFLLYLILGIKTLTISGVMLNCLYSFLGALFINILFYVSLLKTKKFVNYCLIDVSR